VGQFTQRVLHGVLGQGGISIDDLSDGHSAGHAFKKKATEMRVPCTRGFPPRCSLSETIHFSSLMVLFSIEDDPTSKKAANCCVPTHPNQAKLSGTQAL